MTVFTYPSKTGVQINKEVIIASGSSSTPVSVTDTNLITHTIPAHSIGIDGYLVIDLLATRTGSASLVIVLVFLNDETIFGGQLSVSDTGLQTRLIVYADHSTTVVKESSNQSIIPTPYYKGTFADQKVTPLGIDVDNEFAIGLVIIDSRDSATLEGYCLRAYNPSVSKSIISGKF